MPTDSDIHEQYHKSQQKLTLADWLNILKTFAMEHSIVFSVCAAGILFFLTVIVPNVMGFLLVFGLVVFMIWFFIWLVKIMKDD